MGAMVFKIMDDINQEDIGNKIGEIIDKNLDVEVLLTIFKVFTS